MKCRARLEKQGYCKSDARPGYTTCRRHEHKERAPIRPGTRIIVEDGWPHGTGFSGQIGTFVDYTARPNKGATPTTSRLFARIQFEDTIGIVESRCMHVCPRSVPE